MQTAMIMIPNAELQRQANEFEFNGQIISFFHLYILIFFRERYLFNLKAAFESAVLFFAMHFTHPEQRSCRLVS